MYYKISIQTVKVLAILAGAFLLSSASCKKNKEQLEEQIPVLGTCKAAASRGKLTYSASDKSYTYFTAGGGKIFIHPLSIQITHKDYSGFMIEFWGEKDGKNAGTHESLNGKHIKARLGNIRSLIFPDGTKITMNSSGIYDPLISISIYEGNSFHHINLACNVVEYAAAGSESLIRAFDSREPDGETSSFELTSDGLIFFNSYTEYETGTREEKRVDLGSLKRDNPKQVNDLYDDPRLAHT
ncbi:MAG TPA: hypothetical protein PKE30_01005 [Niabella sp.]|nr:hypothetical protein [Niabella sp.]